VEDKTLQYLAVFKLLHADRWIDRRHAKLRAIFAASIANTTSSGFATLSVSMSHTLCVVNYSPKVLESSILWVHHNGVECPEFVDEWDSLQTWKMPVNVLNMQPWTADNGWSSSLGVILANYTHPKPSVCYITSWEIMHCTYLAQDIDTWQDIVNKGIILQVQ